MTSTPKGIVASIMNLIESVVVMEIYSLTRALNQYELHLCWSDLLAQSHALLPEMMEHIYLFQRLAHHQSLVIKKWNNSVYIVPKGVPDPLDFLVPPLYSKIYPAPPKQQAPLSIQPPVGKKFQLEFYATTWFSDFFRN